MFGRGDLTRKEGRNRGREGREEREEEKKKIYEEAKIKRR